MPLLIYFPFIVWSGVVMRMFEPQLQSFRGAAKAASPESIRRSQ